MIDEDNKMFNQFQALKCKEICNKAFTNIGDIFSRWIDGDRRFKKR
jgi:hypothetical protein